MEKFEFPLGSKHVKILLPKKVAPQIAQKIAETIRDLVDTLGWELSKQPETDLTRILDSDIGFPNQVNPILWKYLLLNLHWHQNAALKLFNIPPAWHTSIYLDPNQLSITKKAEISWEHQRLFTSFLMQELSAALVGLGQPEHCISCGDYQLARGQLLWEVTLSHPADDTDLDLPIVNTSVVLSRQAPHRLKSSDDLGNPFSGYDPTPFPVGVIIEHSDPITAKAIGEIALAERYPYAWQKLSSEWQVGITVLHADESLNQIAPQSI